MENEFEESISSSEASFDLAPINQEFKQLAESLRETNQNLHTFEFMLGQYKKLAKVAPVQIQNNNVLEEELKRIAHSIKSIENREGNITSELETLKSKLNKDDSTSQYEGRVSFLEGTILELKAQLQARDEKCSALIEANQRISLDLTQEKEKNLTLDKKLDSERKAAQIVSKDVQKYVEYAKGLEKQIETLKREKVFEKQTTSTETVSKDLQKYVEYAKSLEKQLEALKREKAQPEPEITSTDSSFLCKTCLHDDNELNPLHSVVDRVEKLAVNIEHRNLELIQEIKTRDVSTPHTFEKTRSPGKKTALKLGLAEISAERDSLLIINDKLQNEIQCLINENEAKDAKHKSLKGKCKTLLTKHRGQNEEKHRLYAKLSLAKKIMVNVEHLCKMHEKNHGLLMNYFGGQAEILGRLLSAFMGDEYQGPILLIEKHQKLTSWFCSLHSVLVWTQKQLVTLGERLWSEKETKIDINTLSDISHSLDKDEHNLPSEMMKILENQQSMLQCTKESVNELKQVLNEI